MLLIARAWLWAPGWGMNRGGNQVLFERRWVDFLVGSRWGVITRKIDWISPRVHLILSLRSQLYHQTDRKAGWYRFMNFVWCTFVEILVSPVVRSALCFGNISKNLGLKSLFFLWSQIRTLWLLIWWSLEAYMVINFRCV
jgi:hypothetical protein